jgi:hypothetical protein
MGLQIIYDYRLMISSRNNIAKIEIQVAEYNEIPSLSI